MFVVRHFDVESGFFFFLVRRSNIYEYERFSDTLEMKTRLTVQGTHVVDGREENDARGDSVKTKKKRRREGKVCNYC